MDSLFYILNFKYPTNLYCDKLTMFVFCAMFICLCLIVACCFWKFSKNALIDEDEWECVGEITKILIYPIDGGPALSVNKALCTRCGLRSKKFQDRSIIPYSGNCNMNALALPTENHIDLFDKLGKCMTSFKNLRNSFEAPKEIEINYYGDPITVLPFNPSAGLVVAMTNYVLNIKLGYFDVTRRRRFMQQIRDKLKKYFAFGFTSNYSTFTIVDEESLNEFNTHIRPNPGIYCKPQFVINGKIPFNACDVRVGGEKSKIKFTNVSPCNLLMPNSINMLHVCFGFNMELKNQTVEPREDVRHGGMLHVGDKVYVKRVPYTFS